MNVTGMHDKHFKFHVLTIISEITICLTAPNIYLK